MKYKNLNSYLKIKILKNKMAFQEKTTNSAWTIWYHNPSDNNWDLKSYKNVYEVSNLNNYFKFLNTWKNNLPNLDSSMFFIMRKKDEYEYIYPMWEDKNNKKGEFPPPLF